MSFSTGEESEKQEDEKESQGRRFHRDRGRKESSRLRREKIDRKREKFPDPKKINSSERRVECKTGWVL